MDMHFHGVIYQSYASELARRLRYPHPPFRVFDVRDASEYDAGHIPGATQLRPEAVGRALPEGTTPTTELFVVGSGPLDSRVRETTLALRAAGALRCVELAGGMLEWRQSGYDTESGSAAA